MCADIGELSDAQAKCAAYDAFGISNGYLARPGIRTRLFDKIIASFEGAKLPANTVWAFTVDGLCFMKVLTWNALFAGLRTFVTSKAASIMIM